MDISIMIPSLAQAAIDTIYMVGFATIFTIIFGLPLGILLVITDKNGLAPLPFLNKTIGTIVNMARSLPFIILLVLVIPFTRLVIGTTIGATAAIVPLSLAAIPFFARIAETSLREVDKGLIEAAQAMGCTICQIIFKVLIPESISSLVLGVALTIISLIGYSAMAGAIGGGGLGDLAIRYGYQRYETEVMIATVILLIAIVQVIQLLGDRMAQKMARR